MYYPEDIHQPTAHGFKKGILRDCSLWIINNLKTEWVAAYLTKPELYRLGLIKKLEDELQCPASISIRSSN